MSTLADWGFVAPPDVSVQYVIYERPINEPGPFVVRPWLIAPGLPDPMPGPRARSFPTLEEARAMLPPGLYRLQRDPYDDPTILECWI